MQSIRFQDGRAGIDADLVRRLIAKQFPRWRDLAVQPVEFDGWDNRTYRLGDEMTVRLPTASGYVPAIEKEDRWLPVLAPQLPVPIPVPLATGRPGQGYPYPWSVRRWLDGRPNAHTLTDLTGIARSVAEFIVALQRIDGAGGPAAGEHSFYRGCSPAHYDEETRTAIATHADALDAGAAEEVWNAAVESRWSGRPTWFHGDIAPGNLLVKNGKLSAVIDFGTSGVGDPACDLVVAWTLFAGTSRRTFRAAVDQDDQSWARARGWALWKALISLPPEHDADRESATTHMTVINAVLADHRAAQRSVG